MASGVGQVEFPSSLKTIAWGAFMKCGNLKTATFSEGIEKLGSDEYPDDYLPQAYHGVFEESALENIELPSTLKVIGYKAFMGCRNLESIRLPSRLECIEKLSFAKSGLRSIVIPGSVRTVFQETFFACENLRTAVLNERLEVLGRGKHCDENEIRRGVFESSALEDVELPRTLKRIEHDAFAYCRNLKRIQLPDCLEYIGETCFSGSSLEEIVLPQSVRTVSL